jgi:excisionase family DNA binding protein
MSQQLQEPAAGGAPRSTGPEEYDARLAQVEARVAALDALVAAQPQRAAAEPTVQADSVPSTQDNPADRMLRGLSSIADSLKRIADHLAPEPEDKVGSPYVAHALGVSRTWVADMVRRGEIPKSCVVEGTGNGKRWLFHRDRIDEWMRSGR